MKIKKGDNILVITGKSRGKSGIVQKVLPEKQKIVVTGVNISKHHLKPSRKNPHGGILDMPMPFNVSNAMVVCPHCSKAVRVAFKVNADNKERICSKCKGNLDTVKETNAKSK